MKVSTCYGASPVSYPGPHGTLDSDSEDHGICPECNEHCDYEEAKPNQNCKHCHVDVGLDALDLGIVVTQFFERVRRSMDKKESRGEVPAPITYGMVKDLRDNCNEILARIEKEVNP